MDREPPCNPPSLNATASWYSGDAWVLFETIRSACGLETAKFLFEQCVKMGLEEQRTRERRERERRRRQTAAPFKFPTIAAIDGAGRERVCLWWERLSDVDRKLTAKEKKIVSRLAARYVAFGGYPAGYVPRKLPPIKKLGSVKRDAPNSKLPRLFEEEKSRRGGYLTYSQFAEYIITKFGKRHGKDPDNVIGNLKYWKKKS